MVVGKKKIISHRYVRSTIVVILLQFFFFKWPQTQNSLFDTIYIYTTLYSESPWRVVTPRPNRLYASYVCVREKVEEFFKRKKLIEKYREWNTHTHAQLTGRVEEELKWKTSRRGQARNEIQEEKCWLSWINGWMDLHSSAGANADGTRRELFPRIQWFLTTETRITPD